MSTRDHEGTKFHSPGTGPGQSTSSGQNPVIAPNNDVDPDQGLNLLRHSMQRKATGWNAPGMPSLVAFCNGARPNPLELPLELIRSGALTPLTKEALRQHDSNGSNGSRLTHGGHPPTLNNGLPHPPNKGASSSLGYLEAHDSPSLNLVAHSLAGPRQATIFGGTTPHDNIACGLHDTTTAKPVAHNIPKDPQAFVDIGAQFKSQKRVVDELSGVQPSGP